MSRTPARAFLLDPRLLIGVLLVVGSVAGVFGIVSAVDESVEVYAAPHALSPGDLVDVDDLEVRSVRLDSSTALYLSPARATDQVMVISRAIGAGELLPTSAIGSVEGVRLTSLVLSVDGGLAASVGPGAVVDVWAARRVDTGEFGEPTIIVTGATVVRLVETSTIVTGGDVTAIEVLVPRTAISTVLEAVANEASVSIVPASIPLGG